VDTVVEVVNKALAKQGMTTKAVERWKEEMPKEQEMLPTDKYTIFDRKEKHYRKGIHSMSLLSPSCLGRLVVHMLGYLELTWVTARRAAEMDESQSESQPTRLLER
jgi:hypothetical protein